MSDKKDMIQYKLDTYSKIYQEWLNHMYENHNKDELTYLMNKIDYIHTHFCEYRIEDLTKNKLLISVAQNGVEMEDKILILKNIVGNVSHEKFCEADFRNSDKFFNDRKNEISLKY
jgi:hypothetical protein